MKCVLGHNSFCHSDTVEHPGEICEVRNDNELWKGFEICFSKGPRVNRIFFWKFSLLHQEWEFRIDKEEHSLVIELLLD